MTSPEFQDQLGQLRTLGYSVLKAAFAPTEIDLMREIVQRHRDKMPNTRSVAHSRHLAGFDRFAEFDQLLTMIDKNRSLQDFFAQFFEQPFSAFGLSDITVNRSQHWHSDLLRGQYARYLHDIDPWSARAGTCVKALVYLQSGKSLQIVPGSHSLVTPLEDLEIERSVAKSHVFSVPVAPGDIVMMDIRSLHRGSTEAAMADPILTDDPKILVSNVYAQNTAPLRDAMKKGNDARLKDWDERHLRALMSAPEHLTLK